MFETESINSTLNLINTKISVLMSTQLIILSALYNLSDDIETRNMIKKITSKTMDAMGYENANMQAGGMT